MRAVRFGLSTVLWLSLLMLCGCAEDRVKIPDRSLSDGGSDAIALDIAPLEVSVSDAREASALDARDVSIADTRPPDAGNCSGASLAPGLQNLKIKVNGLTRNFDVYVPSSYKQTTRAPLVLDFHGYFSNAWQQRLVSGFTKQADADGFLLVFPNGYGAPQSWNAGDTCCGQAKAKKLDDVALARAMVKMMAGVACIDLKRVYATGISNGGMMSHRLACEAADIFAAVAPVAAKLDFKDTNSCKPQRPLPLIHLHGTSDNLVSYSYAAPAFAFWGKANGCTDTPQETYAKSKSNCKTHSACKGGVKTTLCSVNGGHLLYFNYDGVNIAELAWKFLKQYKLP